MLLQVSSVPPDHRPNKQPIVLVADDHALVREGMKTLVMSVMQTSNFSEAGDWDSLFRAAQMFPAASLALIDLRMPRARVAPQLLDFSRLHPGIPLVIVSGPGSREVARRIMNIPSVYAYIARGAGMNTLRLALGAAMRRQKFAAPEAGSRPGERTITLTPRREEILKLLRRGMSNKMIAGALGITTGTVKNHISEIFKMLNATNRTQAAHASFEAE